MRNHEAAWSLFSPHEYHSHNYGTLRADDAQVIEHERAYLARLPSGLSAVEIGTGPNLYPLFLLEPIARRIDVVERSAANVSWVSEALRHESPPDEWIDFMARAHRSDDRPHLEERWRRLTAITAVAMGSVYDLPTAAWDVASMHFVAESITGDTAEFEQGLRSFVSAVRPGGWFVASFMEASSGYNVAGVDFPSTAIRGEDVMRVVTPLAPKAQIAPVAISGSALRPGYSGMLVLTGRRGERGY